MLAPPKLSAPVVLVHGVSGFGRLFGGRQPQRESFPGVRDYLEAVGNRVFTPRVSPTATIATRAAELRAYVNRELGGQPFHLIGHSLGGLDGRYLISRLGFDTQVLSLTTVGTPHRGTTFADWGVMRLSKFFSPLLRAVGWGDDCFFDLTTDACRRFNEHTPDVPGVRYFSVAGVCEKPFLGMGWRLSAGVVRRAEGANDGIVSVTSASWGERVDVWEGDHLNLVNWPNKRMRKAGEWTDRRERYGQLMWQLRECEG
jgi:triacylglycerol lipase